ncbi:DUF262 domain-containing protein [Aliarcobacter butzleri]
MIKMKKEEFFKSFPVSIKGFFLNQYDSIDSGKNYLVPIYQRRYVWDDTLVLKLIDDIRQRSQNKEINEHTPYFIGGIVLCRELTDDSEPYLSLEIIDGQQRLTTISIIIASIYNQLKYHKERNFSNQINWVNNQIKTIESLLFLTKEIPGSFDVKTGLTIERSDELHDAYSDILISLKNGNFNDQFDSKKVVSRYPNISEIYCENLINNAILIDTTLTSFNDFELLEFTSQLLDLTYLVVTKTIDIDTGFLVFEKLNDSGASLEPEDLLKSFLFSESEEDEYKGLASTWKTFIDLVEKINPGKAKLTPREFLDNYLIIKGLKPLDKDNILDKRKIFSLLKKYIHDKEIKPNELVAEFIEIAEEHKKLKEDKLVKKYIDPFNFKLGYLIFLTYFNRLKKDKFDPIKYNILKNITRIEFTYLLTGNSKNLPELIKKICFEISIINLAEINKIEDLINQEISKMKNELTQTLLNNNIFTKKRPAKLLLEILNNSINSQIDVANFKLLTLSPEKFDSLYSNDFDIDTYPLYIYRMGNFTLVDKNLSIDYSLGYENLMKNLMNNNPSEITKIIYETNNKEWSKDLIETSARKMLERTIFIFIDGNFQLL